MLNMRLHPSAVACEAAVWRLKCSVLVGPGTRR